MASPQVENGYTKIANELLERLIMTDLSGSEMKIVLFIMRKTYGFGKKEDRLLLRKISEATGLQRQNVYRELKRLVKRKIVIKNDYTKPISYGIQKDYTQWKPLSKLTIVIKSDNRCNQNRLQVLSNPITPTTKETITKETITKEIPPLPPINEIEIIMLQWNEFAEKYDLAQIKGIEKKSQRHSSLNARMKNKGFDFSLLLTLIENSPFLIGQTKENFRVFFDWIIKPSNYQKIIEGNYLDRKKKHSGILAWYQKQEDEYG